MTGRPAADAPAIPPPADAPAIPPPADAPAIPPPADAGIPRVADAFGPLLEALLGAGPPVRIEFWDGSAVGPTGGPGAVRVESPEAIRRILWAPGELGFSRAFVAGDLEVRGDAAATLRALLTAAGGGPAGESASPVHRWPVVKTLLAVLSAARRTGGLGPPLPPPPEEARLVGRRHSPRRDARSVTHHYDVGNDFYRLLLGPSMTYSCARFSEPNMSLASAQAAKHELVCAKLGLVGRAGATLLDVGCGWGSMAIHAARHHGTRVVGITLSEEQASLARRRATEAGVADRVEIRLQDYRALSGERFDAVSSIGMFEHVGRSRAARYFETVRRVLHPTGRLLNHAISSPGGSRIGPRTFMGRYVFPDGELLDVGQVQLAMEAAGFEVRDVESLREHYAATLRAWFDNLESHWDEAVAAVGLARARVWRLYMAGSINGFDDGGIAVHQVLGVVPDGAGRSGMPPTRRHWG